MRYLYAILMAPLAVAVSIAAEPAFRVVVPAESPLRLDGPDVPTSPYQWTIKFEGQIEINGRYRFVYYEESGGDQPRLLLLPDQETIRRLPHLVRPASGGDAERAEQIYVTNVEEAAVAMLPDDIAQQILAGEVREVIGEAEIVASEFSAGYECDAPSFAVKFIETTGEASNASVAERDAPVGC